tara:strand:- start:326 stop:535 length:210 start_codon:yes stop_codon:yes gene_type:complete
MTSKTENVTGIIPLKKTGQSRRESYRYLSQPLPVPALELALSFLHQTLLGWRWARIFSFTSAIPAGSSM